MEITAPDSTTVINYIPKYSWSMGIEHSFVPQIFQEPAQYIPENLEVQWWMGNRLYGEAGFHIFNATYKNKGLVYDGFAVYVGATFKLFMFPNAYFTPTWSIYYEQTPDGDDSPGRIVSTGPTAAFEYFIANRFSVRLDLVNLSYGYFFAEKENESGGQFAVYRAIGLGLKYNFDLK